MKTWCAAQKLCAKATAKRDIRWEDFKVECIEKRPSSECALGTIREAYEKVVKEEAGRLGIVLKIFRKNTDISRRTTAPAESHRRTPARIATFSSGGQSLVGNDGEEALQLVVCNLWRKI